jgi:hypothetical protein
MSHEYNRPGIGPIEFLLAVAHDPTVELRDRLQAIRIVALYLFCSYVTYEDGVPTINMRNLPTPEEWRTMQPILRLYERGLTLTDLGLIDLPLEDMPVKGRA